MSLPLASSILIVDDNVTTIRIIRRLLARIGFRRIDDAANGLEAIVKIGEKRYDLLLADWNMEPVSGHELLKQVRAEANFAKMLVILMTSNPTAEQVVAVKKAGGYFLTKPFTAEGLKEKIDASSLASNLQVRRLQL
jgi:two-component system chemotaxis response regulator CheY